MRIFSGLPTIPAGRRRFLMPAVALLLPGWLAPDFLPGLWPVPEAMAEATSPRDDGLPEDPDTLPDDEELARLREAAAGGGAEDQFLLGSQLLRFKDEDKDREAYELFKAAAEQRHPAGITMTAVCYGDGRGVERDMERAVELLRQASNLGQSGAQLVLGMVLMEGRGVERDPEAALPWLRRSINQGNDFAMIYLSQCHIEGEGVDEDPDAAFRLAERAAGRESSRALMHLAAVHAAGKGTEPDLARAIELLRGIEDNPWADNNLAWLLATAPDPEMHNGAEAVRIIRKALEQLVSEDIWIATDTLAAALARTGDFAAAVEAQQSALEQFGEWLSEKEREDLTDDDWSGKVRERAGEARERMEQRLAIYQSGRPVIVDPDSDEIQADELREQPAEEAPDSPEPVEENREPGMQDSDEAKDEAQAEPETRPRAVPRPRSRPGDADDEDGTPSKLRNFPRDPVPFEDEPRQTRPRDRILI